MATKNEKPEEKPVEEKVEETQPKAEKAVKPAPKPAEKKAAKPAPKPAEKKAAAKTTAKAKAEPVKKEAPVSEPLVPFFSGPILLGAGLLLLGVILLVGELLNFRFQAVMWPFIFIIPGGMMFISALNAKDGRGESLAIFGSMTMMLGVMFFFQQTLDMWASWSYSWALLAPTSIGIAQMVYGKQRDRDGLVRNGRNLVEVGLTLFVVFFVFFEVLLNVSGKNLIPFDLPAFPVALILLGIFVMVRTLFRSK
jgi:hypothetical protein